MTTALLTPERLAEVLGSPPPTEEQAEVIAAPLEPALVVAGAGSGKTATMAARVVWLVATGQVRPEQVLGLTFTRKAAAELSARVRRQLDLLAHVRPAGVDPEVLAGEPLVSTYNSYAARLVSDHALREAVEPSSRLITPAEQWQLMTRVVVSYDGPMDGVDLTPPFVVEAALHLAGQLAEHLTSGAAVRALGHQLCTQRDALSGGVPSDSVKLLKAQRAREQLLPLVDGYQQVKAERHLLDYADQVSLAARIAERHPDVVRGEQLRYAVVLLDEYQDTGVAQSVLLARLFGGGHPVTAVGDPCQSIYGWRGASAGGLRRFPALFHQADGSAARTFWLPVSFRNGERVLAVANALSMPLRAEGVPVPVLVPGPTGLARGAIVCALLTDANEEAEWVADQVQRVLRGPAGTAPDGGVWSTGDGEPRAVTHADVAVLARKRSQFPRLRLALTERGLPVEVVGLGGLLTVPEVQDVVATLRVLADPQANDAVLRLLTGSRWRLGARDLVALGDRARRLLRDGQRDVVSAGSAPGSVGLLVALDPVAQAVAGRDETDVGSLADALDDLGPELDYSPTGWQRLVRLREELRALRRRTAAALPDLVADVISTTGLDVEVAARPDSSGGWAAMADLDAFLDAAADFAGDAEEPTLGAFLAYLAAAEEQEYGLEQGRVSAGDSVKLLTVHAAKGLEWPVVVVPGLSTGDRASVFPGTPRTAWHHTARQLPFPLRGDAADLPVLTGLTKEDLARFVAQCKERDALEERRLAYVAVTRSSSLLLCSGYWWGTGKNPLGPSVFLEDVRAVCETGAGLVDTWAEPPAEDADNPLTATPQAVMWPAELVTPRRLDAARHGAALVQKALAAAPTPRRLDDTGQLWSDEVDLLLAERAGAAARGCRTDVALPAQLPVSGLVALRRDPAALARAMRRPLPRKPAPLARRGTAFHRWLEAHYGQQRLLDPDDVPGAADEGAAADEDLQLLQEAFRASPWWGRMPYEVEVPFETLIEGVLVRGRMDAVFRDADGRFDVIDWKTGAVPTGADAAAAAVQLAAYRTAWAALAGADPAQVGAGFHYVRTGRTVRPPDLLDTAGLAALVGDLPAAVSPGRR